MSQLIEALQQPVYYQCLKILHHEQDAQDAAQEALLDVFTKLDTLQDPNAIVGWANRAAINRCKMALRKRKDYQIPEDEEGNSLLDAIEDADEQVIPDKALDNDAAKQMIVDLVDELPDAQRMCVIMYYYDGMKTREIAEALDISENTVKSRLNYSRKSIEAGVKKYEKQGIKLYGISPISLLLYFLWKDTEQTPITPAMAQAMEEIISATTG